MKMATQLIEINDDYLDEEFCKEFMSQTKQLVIGKKVLIFTRKLENGKYTYSCNLCGIEIGSESSLERHINDPMHIQLMKLDILPYRCFMADAILIEDDDDKIETKYDPLCGLQDILKTMPYQNVEINPDEILFDFETAHKLKINTSESPKIENYCDSKNKDSLTTLDKTISLQKPKKSRIQKRIKHKNVQATSSPTILSHIKKKSVIKSSIKLALPSLEEYNLPKEPEPSFMTTCRHLVTLEPFIDHKIMEQVRHLFTQSIEYEREKFGSSDAMVDLDVLKFFHSIKNELEQNNHPCKPYKTVEAFNRALHHLTMNYAEAYASGDDNYADYHMNIYANKKENGFDSDISLL